MKIAMIGHKRIPSREGGVEIVVEELSVRMAEAGHNVHVYNRKGHHVSGKSFDETSVSKSVKETIGDYKGVHIITVPTFQNGTLNAIVYSILGTIRALFGNYDVIHYHAEGPSAMLWLVHLFGVRTVVTIHGLDWKRAKWGGLATAYLKHGEKVAAKYADEIIVLSQNIKQYFKDTYGRNVMFIPNGIERHETLKTDIIQEKWDLKKDDYILFLGRIVPEKGLHYLVDAFLDLETNLKLVIAGGSSHTDDYMNDLKRKAEGDKRIIFTDFIQGEELSEMYSNAYCYVLPSDLEGMPISLLEAMSYGNCCLVSDIPECTEVIEDKAITFRKGDTEDLREKLEWLIQNPTVVAGYKEQSSDFICNKYNWNFVVKNTLSLYNRLQKRNVTSKSRSRAFHKESE